MIFFPGEPQKTQEAIIDLEGRLEECGLQLNLLSETEELERELNEDDEQERDMAGGIPSSGQTRQH